jgi:hypothetical protein
MIAILADAAVPHFFLSEDEEVNKNDPNNKCVVFKLYTTKL